MCTDRQLSGWHLNCNRCLLLPIQRHNQLVSNWNLKQVCLPSWWRTPNRLSLYWRLGVLLSHLIYVSNYNLTFFKFLSRDVSSKGATSHCRFTWKMAIKIVYEGCVPVNDWLLQYLCISDCVCIHLFIRFHLHEAAQLFTRKTWKDTEYINMKTWKYSIIMYLCIGERTIE